MTLLIFNNQIFLILCHFWAISTIMGAPNQGLKKIFYILKAKGNALRFKIISKLMHYSLTYLVIVANELQLRFN